MSKKKYYVVWQGVNTGVFDSWTACQEQIKGYPGAKYKSFKSEKEARQAFALGYDTFVKKQTASTSKFDLLTIDDNYKDEIIWDSISVDAACSGNPGKMEYQGVDTKTGMRFFHQQFNLGTNNIGEFLAIVHALAMLKKEDKKTPIYTDSKIAMKWVKQKYCATKLKKTENTKKLYEVISRAEKWLANNTYPNPILKWDTERWGEIPADFGRK